MEEELKITLDYLKKQQTVLYPTDTVWGLGCDATNSTTVEKIFEIKNRPKHKSLVVLVSSISMLKKYVSTLPLPIISFIEKQMEPTTIICNQPINLASNVISKENTVAIRVVKDAFCKTLIQQFNKPIISTSANKSNEPTPLSFNEIDVSILNSVDYVVNLHREKKCKKPSKLVQVSEEGNIIILRP